MGFWDHPVLGIRLCWARTDSNGILFNQRVEGNVYLDADLDCEADSLERGPTQFVVHIDQGPLALYAATDSAGAFVFPQVDAGPFLLRVVPPADIWEQCGGPIVR